MPQGCGLSSTNAEMETNFRLLMVIELAQLNDIGYRLVH
ncbi:MAG: hypothetical protein ACI8Z1_000934 [Candidatus Azotimanducaceae bacterium]|jgi:hypothetical protein